MPFRRRDQRDFEDEIRAHIELETEQLVAEGMSPHDARLAARRRFGNVGAAQERFHDANRLVWLEQFLADVRYAGRMLRKSPVFTATAVLTLALGIGANTAVFSVVNGVLLNRLPYPQPDRVVELWESLPDADRIMVSYPDFLDWKARNRVFEDVGIFSPYGGKANTTGDVPREIGAGTATPDFWNVLGVKPILGRTFVADDDRAGAARVALLGAGYWRSEYAADPHIVGRTISLDGEPHTIIGVLPPLPGFRPLDVWLPIRVDLDTASFHRGNHPGLIGLARLKPGVTIEQMRADLARISREIVAEHPKESAGIGAGGEVLREMLVHNIRPALTVLSWAVLCVLLIACVNVANLVLGRATSRRKELALRRALGAGESRVLRLLVIENLLFAVFGGGLGVGLAYAGVRALVAMRPPGVPRLDDIHVNLTVLAFAAIVSVGTGLLVGVVPARQASRTDLNDSLKEGGRGTSVSRRALRMRSALMTVEVAMALVLLVGAALLTRSFSKLLHVDPGVNPTNIVAGTVVLAAKRYPDEERQRVAMNEILRRVQSLPGVTSAAVTSTLPLSGNIQNKFTFEGHPRPKGQEPLLEAQFITPDYFRTVGMRVLAGRGFGPTDVHGGTPVAWIDEVLAKKFFPGENPVGKWLVHGAFDSTEPKQMIVGVVNAVHDQGLGERAGGIVYAPLDQAPLNWGWLVVKTALPFEQTISSMRREIASFDKQLPLSDEQTLADVIGQSVGQEKFILEVLGMFALVALSLAAVGVYGVIAYYVAQRSREIGIRVALGARRTNIVKLVVQRVLVATGAGAIIGLSLASMASGLMTNLLYEVRPTDALTYAMCAVLLLAIAVLAAFVPTIRATRVSPAAVMRAE
ncbi:MAG TPA: ABC transporter permease [Gemmatimonadales bacterium]|nr:ABC transporter permease [Gemmatimonadales bacterium]